MQYFCVVVLEFEAFGVPEVYQLNLMAAILLRLHNEILKFEVAVYDAYFM